MKLKKSAKTRKNEKTQHLFWKKNGKKRVFCDFLKNVDFW